MKRSEIEFVVGYCLAKYSILIGDPLNRHDPHFEPWVKEQIERALGYLDTETKFKSDVMNEIEEMLSQSTKEV